MPLYWWTWSSSKDRSVQCCCHYQCQTWYVFCDGVISYDLWEITSTERVSTYNKNAVFCHTGTHMSWTHKLVHRAVVKLRYFVHFDLQLDNNNDETLVDEIGFVRSIKILNPLKRAAETQPVLTNQCWACVGTKKTQMLLKLQQDQTQEAISLRLSIACSSTLLPFHLIVTVFLVQSIHLFWWFKIRSPHFPQIKCQVFNGELSCKMHVVDGLTSLCSAGALGRMASQVWGW
jgi:hypothetical protein